MRNVQLVIMVLLSIGLSACGALAGHHNRSQVSQVEPIQLPTNIQHTSRVREYYPIPAVVHGNMNKDVK